MAEWPDIMTIEQVASYLQMDRNTVTRLLRNGDLPGKKVGGQWRIRKEDLDRFLIGKGEPAPEATDV